MKKIFIISLFIGFIAIFLSSSFEAKAQCPNGFTPRTVNMTIAGCPYQVDLCVKCSIGPGPSIVSVTGFHLIPIVPPCVPTLTANQVLKEIESQVMTYDFIDSYLCSPFNAPPCPNQSDSVTMYHWLCWRMECEEYFGDTITVYRACDYDNWCEETFTFCYDAANDKYVKTRQSGPTLIGSINCTKEGYQVPKPTIPGEVSECYIYHTPCNP